MYQQWISTYRLPRNLKLFISCLYPWSLEICLLVVPVIWLEYSILSWYRHVLWHSTIYMVGQHSHKYKFYIFWYLFLNNCVDYSSFAKSLVFESLSMSRATLGYCKYTHDNSVLCKFVPLELRFHGLKPKRGFQNLLFSLPFPLPDTPSVVVYEQMFDYWRN